MHTIEYNNNAIQSYKTEQTLSSSPANIVQLAENVNKEDYWGEVGLVCPILS